MAVQQDERVAACFVDLARFTTISELLSDVGTTGTEQLTKLINDFFDPAIRLAYQLGGDVVAFGGDAITVTFAGAEDLNRAVSWAQSVQALITELEPIVQGADSFALEAKLGIGVGNCVTQLVGDAEVRREITSGRAIDEAAKAESLLSPGEIGITAGMSAAVDLAGVQREGITVLTEGALLGRPDFEPESPPEQSTLISQLDGHESLSAFIPPTVLTRTSSYGTAYLDEHRPATILFMGLSSNTLDAKTVDDLARAIEIVDRRGGTAVTLGSGDKGTTLLAAFGAPSAQPQQRSQGVKAGLELAHDLDCRVGVSTGICFAGLLGSPRRWSYNLLGDPPNTAARLMTMAEPNSVLLCEATHRGIESEFVLGPKTALPLKGKHTPEVVRQADSPRATVGSKAIALPIVGRLEEQALIGSKIQQVASDKQPHIVQIAGISGIGKTRLLEAGAAVARQLAIPIAATDLTRSRASRANYGAWIAPIRSLLGLTSESGPAEFMAQATSRLTLNPRRLGILRDLSFGTLATNPTLKSLQPSESAELIDAAVSDAVVGLIANPTLVVADDVGDMDEASLRVLELVCRQVFDQPMVMLIANYPDDELALIADTRIELDELPRTEAIELLKVHAESRGDATTDQDLSDVVDRVGGVPELLRLVSELGTDRSGAFEPASDARTLVMSRIDRLDPNARVPLTMASVLGRHFSQTDFEGAFAEDAPLGILKHLIGEGLIRQSEGEALSFSNPIVREVAYAAVSHGDRSRLHRKFGEFLESDPRYGQARVEELAHHFSYTNLVDRHRRYFPAAARRARQAFANTDAIRWYQKAVEVLDDEVDLRFELAETLEFDGSLDGALETLHLIDGRSAENPRKHAQMSRVMQLLGRTSESAQAMTTAIQLLDQGDDPNLGFYVYEEASVRNNMAGDFERALADGMAQLNFAQEIGDPESQAAALSNVAAARSNLGELEQALDELTKALRMIDIETSPHLAIATEIDLAMGMADLGDSIGGLEVLDKAARRANEIGFRRAEALAHNNAALIRSDNPGSIERAEEEVRKALTAEVILGDTLLISASLGILGLCLLTQDAAAPARVVLARVVRTGRAMGVPVYRDRAYNDLAQAYDELGDIERAEACRSQAGRSEDEVTDEEFDFVAPLTDPAESGLDDELVALLRQADELIANIPTN